MRRERIFRKLFCRKSQINFYPCYVVGHFVKEGIARQTVYNALNRRINSIKESSQPPFMKRKLKKLVNNWKGVSQRRLHFIEKVSNSLNVPQARSIEDFLGICSQKV